jgi:hypothetical protein
VGKRMALGGSRHTCTCALGVDPFPPSAHCAAVEGGRERLWLGFGGLLSYICEGLKCASGMDLG